MLCLAPTSEAGVTAERTRLVFVEGQREASLLLVNQNPYPVLVQAWVDDGALDGEPDTALAPFLPLPPVFRLEPGRQRSLRLLATGQAQARDRESLYWLNIYEIPPQATAEAAGRPRLTVTLRTQMKVLYRPHGLHPPLRTRLPNWASRCATRPCGWTTRRRTSCPWRGWRWR